MAEYGIPYMGSKGSLIYKIAPLFPSADNFYDLFGGGFSVSHFMNLHHGSKYKRFFYNEIKSDIVQLVRDAIAGKYNYDVFKPEWISREKFDRDKESCAYTRCIWSFGNNQKDYMFSPEIEHQKRSLHQAVVFNELDSQARSFLKMTSFPAHLSIRGRRLMCRSIVSQRKGELERLERLQQLLQLERLQQLERLLQLERLERLEQLQQLERLQQLEMSSMSYDQVQIMPSSVIYCDPPYKGTAGYLSAFDHEKFWAWVRKQTVPVFVSEYTAPKDIGVIAAFRRKTKLSAGVRPDSVEKVFGNASAAALFKRR